MISHEEELLSDHDLRKASTEQLLNLRARVDIALQRRAEREPGQWRSTEEGNTSSE